MKPSINSAMKRIEPKQQLRILTLTAMFLAVIVVLEASMVMLPNVQLTVLLMMVFATLFPKALFVPFVVAYVVIDNFTGIFLMGSIDFMILIPMALAWLLLLYGTRALLKAPFWVLLLFSFGFGFVYGWMYIPAHVLKFGITTLWPYFIADLPFEITMAISNIVSVFLLYRFLVAKLRVLFFERRSEENIEK